MVLTQYSFHVCLSHGLFCFSCLVGFVVQTNGLKFNSWKRWQTVTGAATIQWANRVLDDFMRKAPPGAPVKQKDTWEEN